MQPLTEQLHQNVNLKFSFDMSKDRYKLHQMCIHSLKRQNLLVLTHMCFQLVPLVEILSTALMVTLNEHNKSKSITVNTNLFVTKYKETSGLYFISLLLVLVDSSHVVLHAGVCDKGLGASSSQTPGDQRG